MKNTNRINALPFNELPRGVQDEIIYSKLKDIIRQGLLYNLALDITDGQNTILEQAQGELYTLSGEYVGDI